MGNYLEIAQELIRAGAVLDVQNINGATALMYAVLFNRLEIVQELTRAGAALDVQDSEGQTALRYAVWSNRLEIAQELIRAGAALDLQDKHGRTALQQAQYYGYTDIITLLEEAEAAAAEVAGRFGKQQRAAAGAVASGASCPICLEAVGTLDVEQLGCGHDHLPTRVIFVR